MPFRDRHDAGERLARALAHLQGQDLVVLALPRGGVPVAAPIARALDAPLDVICVRKLGVPFQRELGMGAIGEDGVRIINEDVVRMSGTSPRQLDAVERAERAELERRVASVRAVRPRVDLHGRTAVLVDDGIATGSTAAAACEVARAHGAARVVLAVPVAPPESVRRLSAVADEVVSLETPAAMLAIGEWYADFSQTDDTEVLRLLEQSMVVEDLEVRAGPLALPGTLTVPEHALGVVAFAHGSGSSRLSPRNRAVASALHGRDLGTLLFDLLTPEEEADRNNVFDVELLGSRLAAVTRWLAGERAAAGLPLGYFGASTGAAAALWAATEPGVSVAAVVSRGGRPDLVVPDRLAEVRAPTLLVVGGADLVVLQCNEEAARHLVCEHELAVVAGATHLFEEPGTLERVAALAGDWFVAHMRQPANAVPSTGGED